jgi:hypothetical protein
LSIVWSVQYFRPYLFGRQFTIMTDHRPLMYLFSMRDPSSRLIKFRLQLEEYDFKVVYIKGKTNVVADALSRITITSDELKNMSEQIMVMTRAQSRKILRDNESSGNSIKDLSIPEISRSDQPRIAEILRKPNNAVEMMFGSEDEIDKLRKNKLITKEKDCFAYVQEKLLIYINLNFMSHFTRVVFANMLSEFCKTINVEEICIIKDDKNALFIKSLIDEIKTRKTWSGPKVKILGKIIRINDRDERLVIMNDYHLLPTSGHAGVRRMVSNIRSKYYWPGLETDVRNFVKKCSKCQVTKYSRNVRQPMIITTTASSAFEKLYLDIVGPLDTDTEGNKYILTLQCELTKYIEAYPLQRKDTISVARTLVSNFILRYGVPGAITTDRGAEFMSATMDEVCKLLKISKFSSTAYHHESIGSLENMHKHLAAFMRVQCDGHPDTWGHWLPFWCFAYNTTVNTATKYSPFELVFGKKCNTPSNLINTVEPLYNPDDYALELKYRLQLAHKDARENLLKTKELRKNYYDKQANSMTYKKDDLVLVKEETGKKFDNLFRGPFKVIEDAGVNVKLDLDGKIDLIHKNRTKLFNT